MDLEGAKHLSVELMKSSKAVYLSTINTEGYPITRAMSNVRNIIHYPQLIDFFNRHVNPFVIYLSTNTSSSKIAQIYNNHKVSAYYCDPENQMGVLFSGIINLVEDIDIKREFFLDSSFRYYPKGVMDPDYTILKINPNAAALYYKSENVEFKLGE
ncbi:MAG: pyridoxamine 5'-phosphate oxidase family protein [Candidatus Hermodarchaeota archaeon]